MNSTIDNLTKEFIDIVKRVYFAYKDAINGFNRINDASIEHNNEASKKKGFVASGHMEIHKINRNKDSGPEWLLMRNNIDMTAANKPNGKNHMYIGRMAICTIYSYWEDHYREEFRKEFGLKNKSELTSSIFGDLGKVRNMILHNRERGSKESTKLEKFKIAEDGEEIEITPEIIEEIVEDVLNEIEGLKDRYSSNVP